VFLFLFIISIDRWIFAFGGSSVLGSLAEVEMFDIMTNKWTVMKKRLPVPIGGATSIVVHDGILLLG
jgi:hypothetical protein